MSFILMAEVMKIDDIEDPLSKWLLMVLADYADDTTKTCFPSLSTLTKRSRIKNTTLKSRLNWLEEHEHLAIHTHQISIQYFPTLVATRPTLVASRPLTYQVTI